MIKIMYSEVTIYPDKIREVYNNFVDEVKTTLASYMSSLQKRGVFRKDLSPEMAARVFLWILFAYFRAEEIMRPGGMKKQVMEDNMREMIDIFTRGTLDFVQS